MDTHVQLEFFASLAAFLPPNADRYPIATGVRVSDVTGALGVPPEKVQLVFVDGARKNAAAVLKGGERVAVFPPIGGG